MRVSVNGRELGLVDEALPREELEAVKRVIDELYYPVYRTPAVIAFNLYQRRVRREVGRTDAVAHVILSHVHGGAQKAAG